jgi:hypothetical protein
MQKGRQRLPLTATPVSSLTQFNGCCSPLAQHENRQGFSKKIVVDDISPRALRFRGAIIFSLAQTKPRGIQRRLIDEAKGSDRKARS